ncbi:MAG: hypothetical protein ACLSB9_33345 [Hydrogeniiclostridium mannosilyticum]
MENAGREPEKGGTSSRRARQIFAHRILSENPLLIALLGLYGGSGLPHAQKRPGAFRDAGGSDTAGGGAVFLLRGRQDPAVGCARRGIACSAVLYLPAAGLMELIFRARQ